MQVVDRKQFIIMDHPYERKDFRYIFLNNGMVLSYHEDLHIISRADLGIHVLGWAFPINADKITLDENCVDGRRYWAGRWVLIYKDRLYLDCCGTLGCFYSNVQGKIVISSSLHLISCVTEGEPDEVYQVKYGDGHGTFDYYPAPYTIYKNVLKLLPSQNLQFSLNSIKVVPNQQYMIRKYKSISKNEARERMIAGLSCEMKNIQKEFGANIWLTLTGGVDCRTNLALAIYSGIEFKTYTVKRYNTNNDDLILPKKICDKIGKTNLFLSDLQECSLERKELYAKHTSGCSVGTERSQFLAGADVPDASGAIVLWGTVWESYLKYYYSYFDKGETREERLNNINCVCDAIIEKSAIHKQSLTEWLRYVEENPIDGLDWRERLYFEQRVGGWGSYSAQGIDLFDSARIAPINCQELMEILLSLDVKPLDKSIQFSIIKKCCPQLSKIGYAGKIKIRDRLCRKIKKC